MYACAEPPPDARGSSVSFHPCPSTLLRTDTCVLLRLKGGLGVSAGAAAQTKTASTKHPFKSFCIARWYEKVRLDIFSTFCGSEAAVSRFKTASIKNKPTVSLIMLFFSNGLTQLGLTNTSHNNLLLTALLSA